jgi:23S rRNA (cytosine1962-C5)-methyltransferase
MQILIPTGWTEYELIDSGNGQKLERFGHYTLARPDPQIIWKQLMAPEEWLKADAVYTRSSEDKGAWKTRDRMPEKWLAHYGPLAFWAKLTPFKHTGIFPEQSVHWDWMMTLIRNANRPISVLNLFAYTGIASLAAASAGAMVTHVDASKAAISWANENQEASKLKDKPVRWILDDVLKFVTREVKRGKKYDAILMDPPVFGHGTSGQTWKFNDNFPELLHLCQQLLSDQPLFVLINAYAISSSALMLENVLNDMTGGLNGSITVGELALKQMKSPRLLSTGIFGRWEAK